ncbi:MAG: phosphoribosyltransferase family protein [Gammaproteobacteria bacterium]|nr:phosphoribosyltransferase family protein [Gammaproteobacteria bacterium]MCY4219757.1 phosphoribosyltransferase family protein [Gammaproteobacteria bacterium]MCY4273869.1 phosphoribosyltransferase family protein [Gammaproteobacteria bacterium]
MTQKHFISAEALLEDSYLLGGKILSSDFRPDFIVGVWRGGAPIGIAVQEMLQYFGVATDHISVRTSLYEGISQSKQKVRVHGLDYLVDNLNAENALLIVDDVYDSGRSINAIIEQLKSRTRRNMPRNVRVATLWYKPQNNTTQRTPDYFVHSTNAWLVFPHETQGLTIDEIAENKPGLYRIIKSINFHSK